MGNDSDTGGRQHGGVHSASRLGLLLPAVLLLAACAPSAAQPGDAPTPPVATSPAAAPPPTAVSPTPTGTATPVAPAGPVDLSELTVTPDGLGPLVIGEPVHPAMATWDPQGCRTPENEELAPQLREDDPAWGAWIPNYDKFRVDSDGWTTWYYPFEPHHTEDGRLAWLNIGSPELVTDRGIGQGSTEEEVQAAYPEATVADRGGYRVYGILGEHGRLDIEVAEPGGTGLPQNREVWSIRVMDPSFPLDTIAAGDAGGFCSFI